MLRETKEFIKLINEKQKRKLAIKLHVGCGTVYLKNWINIDNNSDKNIKKLDVNWDLKNGLPLKNNTVDFIYNERFIEHLAVHEGVKLMQDFFRVLKQGGVLRIATPDLDDIVFRYFFFWRQQSWFDEYGFGWIKTNAEALNISLREWGHQYMYNGTELKRRLRESGFTKLKRQKLNKSNFQELKNLETRKESKLIIEAMK